MLVFSLLLGGVATADSSVEMRPFKCEDKGIFSDLDEKVRVSFPQYVSREGTSFIVDKEHRTISFLWKGVPLTTYPISLGFAPKGTKHKYGDGKTPEGKLKIIEVLSKDLAAKYGAVSLYLNYPRPKDAKRGVVNGIISRKDEQRVIRAHRKGEMPPKTRLGSSIRIHGGGAGEDWTLGCIAMNDEDILQVLPYVKVGTPVEVLSRLPRRFDRDRDGIPDTVDVLLGAHKVALNGAEYGGGYQRLKYPGGDVPREKGVCTDVIVRAMRNAGYDLQVLMHQDMKKNPSAYGKRKANPNISHRRVKTQIIYFRRHFKDLGKELLAEGRKHWAGGDIIFMDTFPSKHGPDHVGILSDRVGSNGYPLVVNNWTDGCQESEMALLPDIPVTHRFRLAVP